MSDEEQRHDCNQGEPELLARFRAGYEASPPQRDPRKRKRVERRYCEEYLAHLDELQAAGQADEREIALTRADVLLALAWTAYVEEVERAIPLARQAVAAAEQSGAEWQIYRALRALGQYLQSAGEYGEAVTCFQRSLRFAQHAWAFNLEATFESLAECWSRTGRDDHALLMYDWLATASHLPLNHMFCRDHYLVKLGRAEEVRARRELPADPTCAEVASAVAALSALGEQKAACAAAREGLERAEQQGEDLWALQFHVFVAGSCGPRALEREEK